MSEKLMTLEEVCRVYGVDPEKVASFTQSTMEMHEQERYKLLQSLIAAGYGPEKNTQTDAGTGGS